jgi:hypothetical protein
MQKGTSRLVPTSSIEGSASQFGDVDRDEWDGEGDDYSTNYHDKIFPDTVAITFEREKYCGPW